MYINMCGMVEYNSGVNLASPRRICAGVETLNYCTMYSTR